MSKPNRVTPALLSLMMLAVPAVGAAHGALVQDTLKSALVSFFALAAAACYFWHRRNTDEPVYVHGLLCLPLALMVYALASMVWSHAYLGGVEAVRWFVFSLILFLGMNTWSLERVTLLAWSIHLGAVLASLWAALQFWFDFSFFEEVGSAASTFFNRNFFAEFLVCTLPFSVLLLSRTRKKPLNFLLTFSLGFNVSVLMMTGTRSALVSLLVLCVLVPVIVLFNKNLMTSTGWHSRHGLALLALLLGTVLVLGSIPAAKPQEDADAGPVGAVERSLIRIRLMAQPDEYREGSTSERMLMWKTTGRMIMANPVTGVGAGAWEVHSPRYQQGRGWTEHDVYPHNELLQLVAEYGLVGWIFLVCLLSYLGWAAYRTWADRSPQAQEEAPLRALTLASLLAFLLVSNAGFPWHMATTGALFAINLSVLAASDARLDAGRSVLSRYLPWRALHSRVALSATAICMALAIYISQQAVLCESKLMRSMKFAALISEADHPGDIRWDSAKNEMLVLMREGVAINPHYRKLTQMMTVQLVLLDDWKSAIWLGESVLASRPYVMPVLINLATAYLHEGNVTKAEEYFNRARKLRPDAPPLAPLQVLLWSQSGKDELATPRAKELLQAGIVTYDLIRTAYYLGMHNGDPELAILALQLRIKTWPDQAVDGWLKLGHIYSSGDVHDEQKALQAYRAALEASPPKYKSSVLAKIPTLFRSRMSESEGK